MTREKYITRAEAALLTGPQGIPGGTMAWKGAYNAGAAYQANDAVVSSEGRGFYALQATTGHAPPSWPDTSNAYWQLFAEKGDDGADGADGQKSYWDAMPGTPDRISDTSFRIIDVSNAGAYNLRFSAGTVITWYHGGGWYYAKILTASYSGDYVTFTIIGNTLSSGFAGMKYCIHRAQEDRWIIPGMMPAAAQTAMGKQVIWLEDRYVFSAKVMYGTGPTTTGGVWDINDDGSTIFTSKPSISAGSTSGTEVVSDSLSGTNLNAVVAASRITLDYDSGHATTPGSDAYIFIWSMPIAWRYTP